MHLRGLPAFCLALALPVSTAAAAETNPQAEARRHHERGLGSLKNKAFGEAIAELNQAYDLGHEFVVLYDIAQAYVGMEQPVFAVKAFKRYLDEAGKRILPERRKSIEALIAEQQRRIATVTVRATIAGTVIRVDGIEVGKAPLAAPIELGAGPHNVSATADGYRPWEQPLELGGGEQREVEIRLETTDLPTGSTPSDSVVVVPPSLPLPPPPPPDPLAPAVTTPAAPPPAPAFPTRKVVAYALAGVGTASLVVGTVYGVRAISKRHDSDANCPQNQCSQVGVDLNEQAKTAARVADVTLAIGLVSAGVATYLWLRPGQPEASTTSARGLRLAAGIGPGQAAVAVRGAW